MAHTGVFTTEPLNLTERGQCEQPACSSMYLGHEADVVVCRLAISTVSARELCEPHGETVAVVQGLEVRQRGVGVARVIVSRKVADAAPVAPGTEGKISKLHVQLEEPNRMFQKIDDSALVLIV